MQMQIEKRPAALTIADFTLKGIKTFRGVENDQLDASLYCRGKKIAHVFDDGWGGGLMIDWATPDVERIVKEFCASLPPYVSPDLVDEGQPFTCAYDIDLLVGDLLEKHEEEKHHKKLQKKAQTQVLFRLKDDPAGEWRVCGKNLLTPERHQNARDAMVRKYGDKIERFYGDAA